MRNVLSAFWVALLLSSGIVQGLRANAVQPQEPQATDSGTDPTASVKAASEPERRAWNRVAEADSIDKKSDAAEEYLEKFPQGGYAPYAHEIVAVHARQENDFRKFFEHGEQAVATLPEAIMLEVSLAVTYAEQQEPVPAIKHGERAMQVLPNLVASAGLVPSDLEKQRRSMLADTHYALGTAFLLQGYREKDRLAVARAIEHLESSVGLNDRDERSQFRLAFAYQMTRQVDKAIPAFARAVALGGANAAMAREYLEKAYQVRNGSLEGLEEVVSEQKDLLASGLPKP